MMPNERGKRGRAIRGLVAAVVVVALVALGIEALGPLAAGSASAAPSSAVVASGAAASSPGSTTSAAATATASPGGSSSPLVSPSGSPATPSTSPSPTPSPPPDLGALGPQLQRTLDALRKKLSIPGVSVAILTDDGQSWTGASGLRNVATAAPMTTGTAFALASISKTFTAAVVLELVQEGRLTLDQSVAPLLPQFKLDPRITVRMLLDHTSGLPDFFLANGIDAALQAAPNATWTTSRSLSYVPAKHAVPGKAWIYSNTNYLLLGELVTAVTGNPLAKEIRTRLLDPFGLATIYYQAVEAPKEAGTVGYVLVPKTGGGFRARPAAAPSAIIPFRSVVTAAGGAGSLAGTALDVARWMRAWAGGDVLQPSMQAQVLADVANTVRLHASIPYGLGIQQVTLNGYLALGHSGRYIGIRNVVRYLPGPGITIAVMANTNTWDPTRIASALLGVLVPPAPSPTPVPSSSTSPGPSGSAPAPSAAPVASGSPSPSPS